MSTSDKFYLSPEEMSLFGEMGGFTLQRSEDGPGASSDAASSVDPLQEDAERMISSLVSMMIEGGPDAFCEFVSAHTSKILELANVDENVLLALTFGYRLGIMQESGTCANDYGAMYYMGALVEQDYQKARELYELGSMWGCNQSNINLGYIYEYGRDVQKDLQRAFEYYALASALSPNFESIYKMGDMFSKMESLGKDKKKAYALWKRSYDISEGPAQQSHGALRIAKALVSEDPSEYGVSPNALVALDMFQTAEVGLRLEIADGLDYYQRQLEQAIEGQAKAREMLDSVAIDF